MQDEAVARVLDWVTTFGPHSDKRVFRLFGYAGTGKTTIAQQIADSVASRTGKPVIFAAYTGKAASVLRKKGCANATTIHRLIYKPVERRCEECNQLLKTGKDHVQQLIDGAAKCREVSVDGGSDVAFLLRPGSLRSASTGMVIIDECSMVGRKIGEDLLSFGVPILVLGDPAQLPPVGDGGFFTEGQPDVLLTEVHRQVDGCGILDLATAVRSLRRLQVGRAHESDVVPLATISAIDPFTFDQVICGRNDSRRWWNNRMRTRRGFTDPLPVAGDKLICTQNNHDLELMNGEIVTVVEVENPTQWTFNLTFRREDSPKTESATCSRHYFDGNEGRPEWSGEGLAIFDYGYAITCHKSQGSQWGRVLVHNESRVFRDDAARWLYTAITRASEHVTVLGV